MEGKRRGGTEVPTENGLRRNYMTRAKAQHVPRKSWTVFSIQAATGETPQFPRTDTSCQLPASSFESDSLLFETEM